MIAILAAVPCETDLLRKSLSPCEVVDHYGQSLYRGRLFGRAVELLHTGVGKANAASAATLLLSRRPAAIFMVGCGGAFPASGLTIGDLALAEREILGDEGVLTPNGFLDLQRIGLPAVTTAKGALYNEFPVADVWLARAETVLADFAAEEGIQVATGPFVTVSTCSGTAASGAALQQRTSGLCENMEGAGAALVCARHRIPFFELRGISNLVEDRDPSRWNLQQGAEIAQRALLTLLAPIRGDRTA